MTWLDKGLRHLTWEFPLQGTGIPGFDMTWLDKGLRLNPLGKYFFAQVTFDMTWLDKGLRPFYKPHPDTMLKHEKFDMTWLDKGLRLVCRISMLPANWRVWYDLTW